MRYNNSNDRTARDEKNSQEKISTQPPQTRPNTQNIQNQTPEQKFTSPTREDPHKIADTYQKAPRTTPSHTQNLHNQCQLNMEDSTVLILLPVSNSHYKIHLLLRFSYNPRPTLPTASSPSQFLNRSPLTPQSTTPPTRYRPPPPQLPLTASPPSGRPPPPQNRCCASRCPPPG